MIARLERSELLARLGAKSTIVDITRDTGTVTLGGLRTSERVVGIPSGAVPMALRQLLADSAA